MPSNDTTTAQNKRSLQTKYITLAVIVLAMIIIMFIPLIPAKEVQVVVTSSPVVKQVEVYVPSTTTITSVTYTQALQKTTKTFFRKEDFIVEHRLYSMEKYLLRKRYRSQNKMGSR